jgi:hypothetical protein
MISRRPIALTLCAALLVGCSENVPPRTVTEFMDDQLLLEAVLLRCTQNRTESRYDPECVNAREAVKRLEAKQEADRRAELEAQSERKREALRRTQQAAAEARRRTAEMEKRRAELEYQAQFGLPPPADGRAPEAMLGNAPGAVIPGPADVPSRSAAQSGALASGTSAAPVAEPAPATDTDTANLADIRKELKRRNEEGGENAP